ncbi:MAG: hypothetical protein AAGF25_10730 [Pseudomonadota bacterium]
MLRTFLIVSLLAILAGCQTGSTDTAGTLSSATGTDSSSAGNATEDGQQVVDADGNIVTNGGDTNAEGLQVLDADGNVVADAGDTSAEGSQVPDADAVAEGKETSDTDTPVAEQSTDVATAPDNARSANPVVAGVQDIAAIRNTKGEAAAVMAVFACYKRARERSVSLTEAQVCAAQDFVVSREVISSRPSSATGTNDRALLVSKRHPERIGALMKLKGMNQSQFNTFGSSLHAIAEPEYQKARAS